MLLSKHHAGKPQNYRWEEDAQNQTSPLKEHEGDDTPVYVSYGYLRRGNSPQIENGVGKRWG